MRKRFNVQGIAQFIKNRRYELLTIAVMVVAITLSNGITSPFSGLDHNSNNGAFYSLVAKNFLRFGLLKSHFAMAQDPFPVSPEPHAFYIHHPPLLALLVAVSFSVFGEHEWAARLVPVSLSIASLPLVFLVARDLWGKRAGFLSAAVFAVLPMFRVYGRMVNFEPVLTFFILLFVFAYLRWVGGAKRYLWVMCIAFFFGAMVDWPIWFLLPLLGLHYLAFGKKSVWAVMPVVTAASVIGLLYLQLRSLPAHFYDDLVKIFVFRTDSGLVDSESRITLGKLFNRLFNYSNDYFTLPLLVLGACGPVATLIPRYGVWKKRLFGFAMLLALYGFSLANVVVFKNGAFIHDYWNYYALIPLALSAGVVLDSVALAMPKRLSLVPAIAGILAIAFLAEGKVEAHMRHVNESIARYRSFEAGAASLVKPGSLVLTSLGSYSDFAVTHAAYYYGIVVVGDKATLPAFRSSLKEYRSPALMVVETGKTDQELVRYLSERYPAKRIGAFSYYKLGMANQRSAPPSYVGSPK